MPPGLHNRLFKLLWRKYVNTRRRGVAVRKVSLGHDFSVTSIDREFEFYEFFSFLKFNEFYEFFFG